MFIWIFKLIFKLKGWKLQTEMIKDYKQSITIAAPHTSNWDLIISLAAFDLMQLKVKFTLKKEWFRFPFKRIMRNFGGIAIDRTPKVAGEQRLSTVEAMANLFKENEELHIMVTPEGTRSLRTEWKTGFYHTAKLAGVPILCGYLDYEKKIAGIGKIIFPSDNMEADLRAIMAFYKDIKGKYPEKFSTDLRYS
ncbi:MAG: 1-acyl-sn-glycerol-3-phosphate acyltransferase [Sphingobacteriales bacterium]|nr:MAG: 1-acyl-sn-glycerol-3-phosphate acyltransferase [Sphingobacteriales bacterium]